MNPHRSPDYKQLAEEREQKVAELSEELGVLRAIVNGYRRRSIGDVALTALVTGLCMGLFIFVGQMVHVVRPPAAPEPVSPPPACADSAVTHGVDVGFACRPDQTLTAEPIPNAHAILLYRCTCKALP